MLSLPSDRIILYPEIRGIIRSISFQTFATVANASVEELNLLPGIGLKKVKREFVLKNARLNTYSQHFCFKARNIHAAFHQPLVSSTARFIPTGPLP